MNKKKSKTFFNLHESDFEQAVLENGVRLIHQELKHTEVAHCGVLIQTGSRDEKEGEEGYAHFMEHMLFKGTKHRKAFHVLSRIDAVGGEINAYTSKEETFIYCSFLTAHYERAIELLADVVYNSILPPKEIEKEKDVVLDEIDSYLDSPSEQIFDDFEEYLFKGNSLGHNILGTKESIKQISQPKLQSFYKANYQSNNLIFASTGNIPMKKLQQKVARHFSQTYESIRESARSSSFSNIGFCHELEQNVNQCHGILGGFAYDIQSEKRRSLSLLINYLGGPALNNKLNLAVREKHGLTYHLEANYTPFSDTGFYTIYFGTDKRNLKKSVQLILKEIQKIKNRKLGSMQLQQAKQQFIGQLALSNESKLSLMQALAKSIMYFDRVDSLQEIYQSILAVDADELLEIANEVFDDQNINYLAYVS